MPLLMAYHVTDIHHLSGSGTVGRSANLLGDLQTCSKRTGVNAPTPAGTVSKASVIVRHGTWDLSMPC